MVATMATERERNLAFNKAQALLTTEGFAVAVRSGSGAAILVARRGGHTFEFSSLGEVKRFLDAGYWRELTEERHWRFLTCGDCHIAEEYAHEEATCQHCGSDNLRAAERQEVRDNLPFLRQRAGSSVEAAATYERAVAFLRPQGIVNLL